MLEKGGLAHATWATTSIATAAATTATTAATSCKGR